MTTERDSPSTITRDYQASVGEREPLTAPDVINGVRRRYWLIRIFSREDTGRLRALRLIFLFAVAPLVTAFITYLENTFSLAAVDGRGFVEHVGWLAKYLAAPVIVLLLLHVVRSFAAILTDPRFVAYGDDWQLHPAIVQTIALRWCCAETQRTHRLLGGLMMVGFFTVIANTQTTRVAVAVYGEDVWDSSLHLGGYWAGKFFLAFEWGYLLPLAAFLALMIGRSVRYLVRRAAEDPGKQLRVFAHDGCGGFRPLGNVMMQVVYMNIPVGVPMLFLALTHEKKFYSTLVYATLLFGAVILVELYLPFVPLHATLHELKTQKLRELEDYLATLEAQLVQSLGTREPTGVGPIIATECVYRHTKQLMTWPYGRADMFKAATPLIAPAATLILRLIH